MRFLILFFLGVIALDLTAKTYTAMTYKTKLFTVELPEKFYASASGQSKRRKRFMYHYNRRFRFNYRSRYYAPVMMLTVHYFHKSRLAPRAFYAKYKGLCRTVTLLKGKRDEPFPVSMRRKRYKKETDFHGFPAAIAEYEGTYRRTRFSVIDYYVQVNEDNYLVRGFFMHYMYGKVQRVRVAKTKRRFELVKGMLDNIKFLTAVSPQKNNASNKTESSRKTDGSVKEKSSDSSSAHTSALK